MHELFIGHFPVDHHEGRAPRSDSRWEANRNCVVMGKSENRQYKAIYVQGDGEIGQASDIVTLVCLP